MRCGNFRGSTIFVVLFSASVGIFAASGAATAQTKPPPRDGLLVGAYAMHFAGHALVTTSQAFSGSGTVAGTITGTTPVTEEVTVSGWGKLVFDGAGVIKGELETLNVAGLSCPEFGGTNGSTDPGKISGAYTVTGIGPAHVFAAGTITKLYVSAVQGPYCSGFNLQNIGITIIAGTNTHEIDFVTHECGTPNQGTVSCTTASPNLPPGNPKTGTVFTPVDDFVVHGTGMLLTKDFEEKLDPNDTVP